MGSLRHVRFEIKTVILFNGKNRTLFSSLDRDRKNILFKFFFFLDFDWFLGSNTRV